MALRRGTPPLELAPLEFSISEQPAMSGKARDMQIAEIREFKAAATGASRASKAAKERKARERKLADKTRDIEAAGNCPEKSRRAHHFGTLRPMALFFCSFP